MWLASPATPARNRRARLASQPHLAWVFALQGANQNLSAFSIAVWMPLLSPATPVRNCRARLASQPHLAWVFALQGANQNLSAFFPPQDGGILSGNELGSRSQRTLSRLLPGSSDG